MRYTLLNYVANCSKDEDSVLQSVCSVHDQPHDVAAQVLETLCADGEVIKLDGELVDAVCVVVGHLSARTAPAIEAAVQVDCTVAVSVIRHIHAEGHSRCRRWSLARAVF